MDKEWFDDTMFGDLKSTGDFLVDNLGMEKTMYMLSFIGYLGVNIGVYLQHYSISLTGAFIAEASAIGYYETLDRRSKDPVEQSQTGDLP